MREFFDPAALNLRFSPRKPAPSLEKRQQDGKPESIRSVFGHDEGMVGRRERQVLLATVLVLQFARSGMLLSTLACRFA